MEVRLSAWFLISPRCLTLIPCVDPSLKTSPTPIPAIKNGKLAPKPAPAPSSPPAKYPNPVGSKLPPTAVTPVLPTKSATLSKPVETILLAMPRPNVVTPCLGIRFELGKNLPNTGSAPPLFITPVQTLPIVFT